MASASTNSLVSDLDHLKLQDIAKVESVVVEPDHVEVASAPATELSLPTESSANEPPERKKPYVNPERVKTGGTQRVSKQTLSL